LEGIEKIRRLYKPIQPTIKNEGAYVTYREIVPSLELQPFIYCYWQLKTTAPLTAAFQYKVVADGCIDIFFELNDPSQSFVMGFCKKYTEFPLSNSFNYVGVRFLPTMFPQIFKINAHELSNRFERLDVVIPTTSKFIESKLNDLNLDETKLILDNYFEQMIMQSTFDEDQRLYKAIDIILKNFGVVNIETDLNTGISARQLRRLFQFYVGDTAKTFSKVVQFQNILKAKPSTQSLKQNKLFYDVGYYDQAHFIHSFKNACGVSPSEYVKTPGYSLNVQNKSI